MPFGSLTVALASLLHERRSAGQWSVLLVEQKCMLLRLS